MYKEVPQFGFHIFGKTIGRAWIDLIEAVFKYGKVSFDEGRKRLAISNARWKSATQILPDKVISQFGDKKGLKGLVDLTFFQAKMYDTDVVKNFKPGAKSYYKRIKEGKMLDFVIARLGRTPESKKAVMVFPIYEDYQAVVNNQRDGYLPCLVSVQFRLVKQPRHYKLNTIFNFRSMDVFQKGHGNFVVLAMLSQAVAKGLSKKIKDKPIRLGFLDGIIADAHIYVDSFNKVEKILSDYHKK